MILDFISNETVYILLSNHLLVGNASLSIVAQPSRYDKITATCTLNLPCIKSDP